MKNTFARLFLEYLKIFAQIQLFKYRLLNPNFKVIGITGSAGKSSTLLATEATLKPDFKVKTNSGLNSESGIPLSILGLSLKDFSLLSWLKGAFLAPLKLLLNWSKLDLLLLEMGIDSAKAPKNMSYLLSIVKPDIGVFLNVTPVHLQNFQSLDDIAREKAKLVNQAQIAIINPADPLVKKYTKNKHTLSLKPARLNIPGFYLPPVYDLSLGAALAVAKALNFDKNAAQKNLLANFKLPPGRASIFQGLHQAILIDSSYNSSPLATAEMLHFLKSFPSPRIAVLGDMRELGAASPPSHQNLYRQALDSADLIVSVGPESSRYFGSKAHKFLYWWQALDFLQDHLPPKATLLVKGSQNTIYLEELVKGLLKYPKNSHKLCRQTPYWLRLKDKFRQNPSL